MKTLTLTTLAALILAQGCMADWTEPAVAGIATADASSGPDQSGQDASTHADTGADASKGTDGTSTADSQKVDASGDVTESKDTTAPLDCTLPTKDRLVNNFDGTWYDKMLDLNCVFMPTESMGKRCLPVYGHLGTDPWGNPDFPEANVLNSVFVTEDCSFGMVVAVKPDALGKWARFGFTPSTTKVGIVVSAHNLVDVPYKSVLTTNPNSGKAQTLKGVSMKAKTNGVWSCKPMPASLSTTPPQGPGEYTGFGGSDFSLMATNDVASIPECPFLTGLDLFAPMP